MSVGPGDSIFGNFRGMPRKVAKKGTSMNVGPGRAVRNGWCIGLDRDLQIDQMCRLAFRCKVRARPKHAKMGGYVHRHAQGCCAQACAQAPVSSHMQVHV